MTVIRQNLFWAFAYNIVLIPVAMGVAVPVVRDHAVARRWPRARWRSRRSPSSPTRSGCAAYDARPEAAHRVGRARRRSGHLREAWFLGAIALASLGLAGGVMAADRIIDAGATKLEVTARSVAFTPADLRVRAGETVVLEFTNDDPIFHDWEVDRARQRRCRRAPGPDPADPVHDRRARHLRRRMHGRGPRRGGDGRQPRRRGRRLTLDMPDPASTTRRARIATPEDPRDLPGDFAHRVEIDVRFADTDAMGHVNNAIYLTYCEMARIRYWTDVTGEPIAPGHEGAESLILAEARITYRAPGLPRRTGDGRDPRDPARAARASSWSTG